MTTPVEPGLVDANILVYAIDANDPRYAVSRALLGAARDPSITLYVTSQVLCEFYSIVTNPRRVVSASSPPEAFAIILKFLALPGLRVLPAPIDAIARLMSLLRRQPVKGGRVFDLQIVAVMLANNVNRIYTFNESDFDVFPELVVVVPRSAQSDR